MSFSDGNEEGSQVCGSPKNHARIYRLACARLDVLKQAGPGECSISWRSSSDYGNHHSPGTRSLNLSVRILLR
jgi:hypothetical protein